MSQKLKFYYPPLTWPAGILLIYRILKYSFIYLGLVFSIFLVLLNVNRWTYLGLLCLMFFSYLIFRQRFSDYSLDILTRSKKQSVNLAGFLSPAAKEVLIAARFLARKYKIDFSNALLLALIPQSVIRQSLVYLDINWSELRNWQKQIQKQRQKNTIHSGNNSLSFYHWAENLIAQSLLLAQQRRRTSIGLGDLFLTLGQLPDNALSLLLEQKRLTINDAAIALDLNYIYHHKKNLHLLHGLAEMNEIRFSLKKKRYRVNKTLTSRPTPLLDKYGVDLTQLAKRLRIGVMIGHQKEYNTTLNILTKKGSNNVLLIGLPHVGKETIVSYLAFNLAWDNVPPSLRDRRLVKLDLPSLLEGNKNPLELANLVSLIVREILRNEDIILFLPNISSYQKVVQEGGMSILHVMEPLFTAPQSAVVATSTLNDYHQYLEKDYLIEEDFSPVRVQPVSSQEATKILALRSLEWQRKNKIKISYRAIKRSIMLAQRFLASLPLPASAEMLIQEALVGVKNRGGKLVTENDIVNLVSKKTNVPLQSAQEKEENKLINLESLIHQYLINQEQAVRLVAGAMRQYRAGLKNPHRPIASFLFVGPTGVGKTELAKTLARIYFGSEETMLRFDMSEYQDRRSVNRFIGSSDRKIAGELTEAIKANPFSLILLDEFEKANPLILNLFLPILDEGRATDNWGEAIDFTNSIIIATSNALSVFIKNEIEKNLPYDKIRELVKQKLTNVLHPELINRFDEVVVFRTLTPDNLQKIVVLQLNRFAKIAQENKRITVSFSPEVIGQIARLGYNPVFGARPLRSVIRHYIKDPLAVKLLQNQIKAGDKVLFTFQQGRFNIKVI